MPLATAQSLGWNLSRTLMTVIVIIETNQGYFVTRMSGYAFCDFVLEAYEHQMFLRRIWGEAAPDATLPLAGVDLSRRPFENLASNYCRRFYAECGETAAMPDDPLGGLDWNRIGGATLLAGDGQ